MIIQSLKFVASTLYKYILPTAFTAYIFFLWQYINTYECRIMLSCALILFVRVENAYAFYRFSLKKSAYEYEVTIVLTLVKIVNSIQFQQQAFYDNFLEAVCNTFFNFFLISNLLCYFLSFLIIIIFALVLLVGFIRGDPELTNPRRGLNEVEIEQLPKTKWHEINQQQQNQQNNGISEEVQMKEKEQKQAPEQRSHISNFSKRQSQEVNSQQNRKSSINQDMDNVCSICLMKYEGEEEIIQLPKCKHFFHSLCITEWLKTQPQCPFCRNNVRMALIR